MIVEGDLLLEMGILDSLRIKIWSTMKYMNLRKMKDKILDFSNSNKWIKITGVPV